MGVPFAFTVSRVARKRKNVNRADRKSPVARSIPPGTPGAGQSGCQPPERRLTVFRRPAACVILETMNRGSGHILSKSTFIRGCQCHKSLWLYKHRYQSRDRISAEQQAIFDRGSKVGRLARELFPGGVDASPPTPFQYDRSVALTAELVRDRAPVIYEAAFRHAGVLAAMDILVSDGASFRAFEVKSSTSVTDTYLLDAALQYFVITGSGLPLSDISIICINPDYVRSGKLDLFRLFVGKSVRSEVIGLQPWVVQKIQELSRVARAEQMPEVPIGPHCHSPYPCDFLGTCWKEVPEYSVFDIARLDDAKKFELYRSGIVSIAAVPEGYPLSERQRLQVESERSGLGAIDGRAIEEFVRLLHYPLLFLDFETFQPAVPLYDDSSPYQQIPFQFSLHRRERPGDEPSHVEFLAEAGPDPRDSFAEAVISAVGDAGSVLVYNQSFEVGRLSELAALFPERAAAIEGVIGRVVDLMAPFQRFDYYLPSMRGSYSIKRVLPALVPELSYDSLAIGDGTAAALAFTELFEERDPERHSEIRRQLLEYCRMDTYAMVRIFDVLCRVRES